MAFDNGHYFASQALPTPTDTPYQTPSRGTSRLSSGRGSSSPFANISPASMPHAGDSYFPPNLEGKDSENVEKIPPHDPRRFTPDLNNSLIGQIHILRKEIESKNTAMESLEENLHLNRVENERLIGDLNAQTAESQSLRQQIDVLENTTLKALEEIASERDLAVTTVTDTQRRLDNTKKKLRLQEDDADKAHALWEKDKEGWESEKRNMERKVHVVEKRIKTMVAEVISVQSTAQNRPAAFGEVDAGMRETCFTTGTDAFSIRSDGIPATSHISNRSIDDLDKGKEDVNFRQSRMSGLHEMGGSNMSGLSLAEELELGDHDSDDEEDEDAKNIASPDALPEETIVRARRYSEDIKARKVMGFSAEHAPRLDAISGQHSMNLIDDYTHRPRREPAMEYIDTSTQFSPPQSPTQQAPRSDFAVEKQAEQTEHAANQSRKRVAIPSPLIEQTLTSKPEGPRVTSMLSVGSQTVDESQNVESKLKVTATANDLVRTPAKTMTSSSTQTTEDNTSILQHAGTHLPPPSIDVPVIAIHPPASRPPSSHTSVVLPPRTKNAACQVVIELPKSLRSSSAQTEEIRVGKRSIEIPPRSHLANLSAQQTGRTAGKRPRPTQKSQTRGSRRNLKSPPPIRSDEAPPSSPVLNIQSTYPNKNDGGPLHDKQDFGPRRPARRESVLAGFDAADDEASTKDDFSDDEFVNAKPIRKTLSKVHNSWRLVPYSKDCVLDRLESASESEFAEIDILSKTEEAKEKTATQRTSRTFPNRLAESQRKPSSIAKQTEFGPKVFVSNDAAEHSQQASNNSAFVVSDKTAATVAPPFPVPTRSSSRKIPLSASDGAASPSPYATSFSTARRGKDHGRPPVKQKILRKVQSAAAVSKVPELSQPLPPMSVHTTSPVPGSPLSLEATQNQFILPYDSVAELPSHLPEESSPRSRAGDATFEPINQQTSVVDAIAQTMVGEWMWKYVRKRTSFGMTETPQAEFEMGRNRENGSGSGVRHKRWVWLAPYDRAVIWSSKQPTSGPALLGKGGRKLSIQSVLDVKDDTPLPKSAGSQSVFDRSILLLTPERALKFTAVSAERHYIWLTALSFLTHSPQGMDDLASPPPLPKQEYRPPSQGQTTSFRRTPIRDSIRVAKAKSRPNIGVHSYTAPMGTIEQEIIQGSRMAWADSEAVVEDAAEPPQVPRVSAHGRKRSSTGPRPIALSALHSYPGENLVMSSHLSSQFPTSREKYDRCVPLSRGGPADPRTVQNTLSRRPTASTVSPPPVVPDNFFDAVGTMRMEAFVEREFKYPESRRKGMPGSRDHRPKQGHKKDLSYWGVAESGEMTGVGRIRGEDPFLGF